LGHTTCLVLVGFAYGLRGFFLAAGASTFAAAVVLRLLFRSQLRAWSAGNEKWQALESVVVSCPSPLGTDGAESGRCREPRGCR
jgi:hypothetical protein